MRGGRGGAPLGVAVAGCRELAQPLSRARTHPAGPHDDEDAKLDVALDESFPTSDAPSNTQPGKGKDPPPSSGYDEEAEKDRARMKGKE